MAGYDVKVNDRAYWDVRGCREVFLITVWVSFFVPKAFMGEECTRLDIFRAVKFSICVDILIVESLRLLIDIIAPADGCCRVN